MSTDTKSYKEHNSQYESADIESIRLNNEQKILIKEHFNPDQPLGQILIDFENKIKYAVDIGSGVGWASSLLSQKMDKVYAIEPSQVAQNIAKQIYSDTKNIEYLCGFAEEQLSKLTLQEPTLFVTSCVLSHLNDNTTSLICKKIDSVSVPGCVFSFSENWSESNPIQQELWYSRTREWWKSQFPNWDIIFNTTYKSNIPGMYKGFWGIKQKIYEELNDEEFWSII